MAGLPIRRGVLACLAALTAPTFPAPARAQGDAGEIVVTARRLEEEIRAVPLNIGVVSHDAIGAGAVDSLQSLSSRVPGLYFESIWGGWNSFPTLRGQTQSSAAGDAVAMFVDGVYQANHDAIDVQPLDLERIEVVKGPQSALFGHSAFAGLIHYVPAAATEEAFASAAAGVGTDGLRDLRGTLSGPVSGLLKARVAASWQQSDGTWRNAAAPGQHLGNARKSTVAATVATRDGSGPLSLRLSGRYGESRSNQPPFFSVDYRRFNCGTRDPSSGAWSYYCGAVPIPGQVSLSADLPDSRTRTGQLALHMALDMGSVELRSDTSYYRARSNAVRDVDGGPLGDLYGVCIVGLNCTPPGSLSIPVVRLQRANILLRRITSVREFTQEMRLGNSEGARFGWQVGGIAFETRTHTQQAIAADRGPLAGNERLTSLVLGDTTRVGPLAFVNNALTASPGTSQFIQNDFVEVRRTLALFATGDYRLGDTLRSRAEVRANWERVAVDSRTSQFARGFGTSIGARHFFDLTTRLSLDYRPSANWLLYTSYARGSRSGGINTLANLSAKEQVYAPETNWTAEIGAKYSGHGLLRRAEASAFHIDWRDTQIAGFSAVSMTTPLILRNTKGVETWGVELSAELVPAPWLGLDGAFSYSDARFKQGSEDPGSSAFCGLGPGVSTSTFCRIVPSVISPGTLVPDVSGNSLFRSPKVTWAAGLTLVPKSPAYRGARFRLGLNYQSSVYERQINGLYYGERLVLDARVTAPLGLATLAIWGTNLTDARFVRVVAGRMPPFYIGQPRPTDLILGEGRRLGITVSYQPKR